MELLARVIAHFVVANVTQWDVVLVIKYLLKVCHEFLPFLPNQWCLPIDVDTLYACFDISPLLVNGLHPLSRMIMQGSFELMPFQSD